MVKRLLKWLLVTAYQVVRFATFDKTFFASSGPEELGALWLAIELLHFVCYVVFDVGGWRTSWRKIAMAAAAVLWCVVGYRYASSSGYVGVAKIEWVGSEIRAPGKLEGYASVWSGKNMTAR
jgi:hypothetical protein